MLESSVKFLKCVRCGSNLELDVFKLDHEIKEGILVSSEYTVVGTTDNEIFSIPNEDVDLDTLRVSVGGEVYTRVDDITEVKATDKVYFVQEGREKQYEIYFGDGVIGKKPSTDDEVRL